MPPEYLVVVAVFLDGRFYVSNAFPANLSEVCESWLSQFSDDPAFSFRSVKVRFSDMA